MRLKAAAPFLLAAALVGLAACSSAPSRRPAPPAAPRPDPGSAVIPPARPPATPPALADRVVELARTLLDSPYRYAGGDKRGFDCSGLTAYVFERFGVALPRTAASQASTGSWVAADELAPGDLVFFGPRRDKAHHVGLVVSRPGEPLTMIHASSSRGVIETEVTTSRYWLERLRFGRRVLGR